MLKRRVAPSAIVVGQSIVRWTIVGCGDLDDAGTTPFRVVVAAQLETSTTAQAIIEEGCAESCSVGTITLGVQVSITTSPSYKNRDNSKQIKKESLKMVN